MQIIHLPTNPMLIPFISKILITIIIAIPNKLKLSPKGITLLALIKIVPFLAVPEIVPQFVQNASLSCNILLLFMN